MDISPTTALDLPELVSWLGADPFHRDNPDNDPVFMFTGFGILAFQVIDDKGTICFMKVDKDGDLGRISTQFGPEEEVSKRRVIVGLSRLGIPICIKAAKKAGLRGVVYESVNPPLIEFCRKKFGFEPLSGNDYVLKFEDNEICAA